MPAFLTFALVAPIASFGALAVGERRSSWQRPARSAVLGLIGACLGLAREDAARQEALARDYGLALLCESPGGMLADFHTAQTGRARKGQQFRTRAAELQAPVVDTTLSRRDYRVEAWHLAALWAAGSDPLWSLDALAEAMGLPVFSPYLGRKSCPLGLPLAPMLHDAADPAAALRWRRREGPEKLFRAKFCPQEEVVILARDAWPGESAGPIRRVEQRRDQPLSRTLWQFALREEVIESFPADGALP